MKCKKHTYKDHNQAIRAVHLISSRGVKKQYTPVRAYECEECGSWHITHKTIEQYLDFYSENVELIFKDKWKKLTL